MAFFSKIGNLHFQQLEDAVMRTQDKAHRKHTKMQGEGNQEWNCLCGKQSFCKEGHCFLEAVLMDMKK